MAVDCTLTPTGIKSNMQYDTIDWLNKDNPGGRGCRRRRVQNQKTDRHPLQERTNLFGFPETLVCKQRLRDGERLKS